jgi:hypothetical protein
MAKELKIKLDPRKIYLVRGIGENPVLNNKETYKMNGSNAQKVIDAGEAELINEVVPHVHKGHKTEVIKK